MIQITKRLYLTADRSQYILGEASQTTENGVRLIRPSYYSSISSALREAVSFEMRQGVADGEITTLQQYIRQLEQVSTDLASQLEAFEA